MHDSITIFFIPLIRQFPNDEAARIHFEEQRWGESSKMFTVRTGTGMERSHISLQSWLKAFHLDVTERKGISSMQLSKHLGSSQKSAWLMLGRIRAAAQKGIELLGVVAEAYATYIRGRESNKHESKKLNLGRGAVGKTPVRVLAETKQETVHAVLDEVLEDDAMLVTNEHKVCKDTKFMHKSTNHSAKVYKRGGVYSNRIESVWAVLKCSYHCIYHGFFTKHAQTLCQ